MFVIEACTLILLLLNSINFFTGIFLLAFLPLLMQPCCICRTHSHSLVIYMDLFYNCLWTETSAKTWKFSTLCSLTESEWSMESLEKWRFYEKKHKWPTEKGSWLWTIEWNSCSCQGTESDIDQLNSMYLQKDCAWGFMGGWFLPFILHGIWLHEWNCPQTENSW